MPRRLSLRDREMLALIPDDEYAREQIAYHEKEVKRWKKRLKQALKEKK